MPQLDILSIFHVFLVYISFFFLFYFFFIRFFFFPLCFRIKFRPRFQRHLILVSTKNIQNTFQDISFYVCLFDFYLFVLLIHLVYSYIYNFIFYFVKLFLNFVSESNLFYLMYCYKLLLTSILI